MSESGLCTWHNCRLPRGKLPGGDPSLLCERVHKTETSHAAPIVQPKDIDPPPKVDLCEACGNYHGSVNEAFDCLKNEIRRQRGYIHTLRGMLAKATGQED